MGIYAGRAEVPKLYKHMMAYEETAARPQDPQIHQREPQMQRLGKDKATFSQEGLRSAKEMREYLDENGLNFNKDGMASFEELDKQLRTRYLDCSNYFLSEMQEVMAEERKAWGSEADGHSFDNSMSLMAKSYQVVHDRIVDEFLREGRETTYVIDEVTGLRREETVDDRLAELDLAYDRHTTFLAASKKAMAEIKKAFWGVKLPEHPQEIEKKAKEACMQAVSEENLGRLRQQASSFRDYKPQLTLGAYWEQILASIW